MCWVADEAPKTSTTCPEHLIVSYLQEETINKPSHQSVPATPSHPVCSFGGRMNTSLRQCFRPPCKLYRNQRTRPTVFSRSPSLTCTSLPNTLIMSSALPFGRTVRDGRAMGDTRECGWKASASQVPNRRNAATTAAPGILVIVSFVFFCDEMTKQTSPNFL